MTVLITSNRDVCPECQSYIYRNRVRLWVPEINRWGEVDAWECLCGTWALDRYAKRHYLTSTYLDPETVDNMRQIAELMKGTEDADAAVDRLDRALMEDD